MDWGSIDESTLTPGMRQFISIKKQYPDHLLLFRMGDFYETFFDDAITAAKTLDITLTSRGKGERKTPLAGIPYHALEPYLAKLVKKGFKIAICEQLEDPKQAKGLVKRGITRIVTPGTLIEDSMLDAKSNNYLMSLTSFGNRLGIAICDMSTGEFLTAEIEEKELKTTINKLKPSECIVPITLNVNHEMINKIKELDIYITNYEDRHFRNENAYTKLTSHFRVSNLEGFGIENKRLGISAAGALIQYLKETQMNSLKHINKITLLNLSDKMILDVSTIRNLELLKNIRDGSTRGTLLTTIDRTKTPMGSRLIKRWMLHPLLDKDKINRRLDAVEELKNDLIKLENLKEQLDKVYDLERLISRINYGNCNPKDLIALKLSLWAIPNISDQLNNFSTTLLKELKTFPDLSDITSLIQDSIRDDPPTTTRDGNIIKKTYNQELAELYNITTNGKKYLLEIEEREKQKTGITHLRIGFNKVFGYYIEVSKSQISLVPESYIRKQTLTNGERYITEELKEWEEKILNAQEKIIELEHNIFMDIVKSISEQTLKIQQVARQIASLDVLSSFATIANRNDYCKPKFSDDGSIILLESRHPVLEKIENNYISNDINLDNKQIMIITGPNMAGKSSIMRQVAHTILLAQIGSFVPATEAKLGIIDRIFTRIGAYDDLTSGQSTFMVEMNETANILNNATSDSLIILDEIGRGTSTFDGVAIAWSVAEHIYNKIRAKTMFATHYHVLNKLEDSFSNIKNYNIAVKENNDEIIFLRKLVEGSTDQSFGVEVAKLAGLPEEVISRAKEIQTKLETEDKMIHKVNAKKLEEQKRLFQ